MKFRKKPVVIEAMQWTGSEASYANIYQFVKERSLNLHYAGKDTISIVTIEGRMVASKGDWIIKGVKGEFHPIKDDIFRETYEPMEQ